jgi:hypothetical protein
MPDQQDVFVSELGEQEFEIVVERSHDEVVGIIRDAVPPKVQRDHEEPICQVGCNVVPPMRVRSPAVQQDEFRIALVAPSKKMQLG